MLTRVLRCAEFLQAHGSATAVEINAALHTTEGRKIISEMIKAGYQIEKTWTTALDADNNLKRFKEYKLAGES